MEPLVRHRHRPGHVVIDVPERDRLQDRLRRRPVSPVDQQQALGRRVVVPDPGQQPGPGHSGHRLGGQHDADLALPVAELSQQADRVIGGSSANDLVVSSVPAAQLAFGHGPLVQIVVDEQQDRDIHALHNPIRYARWRQGG